ncbi:MAG TPA: PAS domain S-box protein [Crenalkalicoccus sp.]|nr:PAS domain S-box protein [Crenalkalicoccus sp.]
MSESEPAVDDRTYRLLVEAMVDYAVYLLDPEGRVRSWNPGAQRITGYRAEDIIGKPFATFFTEEDRRLGRPEQALETARRSGHSASEGWRERKDGSRFRAVAVLEAVRDDAGRLIGFAKITRDITEQREAEQALRESERRFRLLVQGVTDYAIFMLDPEGRITNWNAGARRIKGYEGEEIIGQHFSRFYTEEDRAAGLPDRVLEQVRETGRFEAEGWRVRKDGRRFWASVVIDAIHDEDGSLIGFAKITRDITERREAERVLEETRAQLAHAQKLEALGQLTGGIAHDFNNLLHVISGGAALAAKLAAGDDRLSHLLTEMQNAAARGATITRQLLAFSRQMPTRPDVLDTAATLRQITDLFSHSLRGDIRVDLQLGDDLRPVRADPAQLQMALLNIAVNARDAMPNGGELRVSARNVTLSGRPNSLTGPFVAISLRDTGSGIPEEVLGRIFDPFFTTKPIGKGTGLGLSQVHGFAQQSGGAVTVTSKAGEGTEVTLLLPAAPPDASPQRHEASAQSGSPSQPPEKGLRILVVDDDAAVGRLTVGMLEGAGHQTAATTDPSVALEWLASGGRFDLVLSDVIMPGGMSGVDFAREVRRRWAGLPLLLTTGYAEDGYVVQREFPLLHKPFTTLELTQTIASLLRREAHVTA